MLDRYNAWTGNEDWQNGKRRNREQSCVAILFCRINNASTPLRCMLCNLDDHVAHDERNPRYPCLFMRSELPCGYPFLITVPATFKLAPMTQRGWLERVHLQRWLGAWMKNILCRYVVLVQLHALLWLEFPDLTEPEYSSRAACMIASTPTC